MPYNKISKDTAGDLITVHKEIDVKLLMNIDLSVTKVVVGSPIFTCACVLLTHCTDNIHA